MTANSRGVARVVKAQPTSDGAGVRLHRALGNSAVGVLDPFLLLDEIRSDDPNEPISGFPDHPHRGLETVTYMLAGEVEHKDTTGNEGHLCAGGVQWMTAGSGIIHSEMPKRVDGVVWCFQLWINLARADKMCPPRYQDISAASVPEVENNGAKVRVIAGESHDLRGPVTGVRTDPLYLDVKVSAHGEYSEPVDPKYTSFAYVFEGDGCFGLESSREHQLKARQLGVLTHGDCLKVRAGAEGVRFLLVAARPINEPIAWYGPFVMNTRAEILQAVRDFEAGRLVRASS